MRATHLLLTSLPLLLLSLIARPADAYWDDVHYHLTYYVARTIGYTPEQAYRIAAADLSIDYAPTTEPTQMSKLDYVMGNKEDAPEKQRPRWMFHAFRDETQFRGIIGGVSKRADDAVDKQQAALLAAAESETSTNPGAYLHFLQDRGPHRGFGSAFGHYFDPADPVGSTKKARASGLAIGGAVDWFSYPSFSAADETTTQTATALRAFMVSVSPRQKPRPVSDGDLRNVASGLYQINDAPGPLQADELGPYVGYVKARNGVGTMPSLTAEQQAKFAKHSDGPNLAAAAQQVGALASAAGMIEPSIPSYLQARKEFAFDADGNVVPGLLNKWVLVGSLRVNLAASGAGQQAPVEMVIKAPPTYWNDQGYDLTNPRTMNVPQSITWEQIPIGKVIVELRRSGQVLVTTPVTVDKAKNETTIQVGAPAEAGWVLKPGFPKINPTNLPAKEATDASYPLPNAVITLAKLQPTQLGLRIVAPRPGGAEVTYAYDYTLSRIPPNTLALGEKVDIGVTGTANGGNAPVQMQIAFSGGSMKITADSIPNDRVAIIVGKLGRWNGKDITSASDTVHFQISPLAQGVPDVKLAVALYGRWRIEWEWRLQEGGAGNRAQTPSSTTPPRPTPPPQPTATPSLPPTGPGGPPLPGGPSSGLGANIGLQDGKLVVTAVSSNSLAAALGLKPGDRIQALGGQSTDGMTMAQVSALVRASAGKPLSLQIVRQADGSVLNLTIATGQR